MVSPPSLGGGKNLVRSDHGGVEASLLGLSFKIASAIRQNMKKRRWIELEWRLI